MKTSLFECSLCGRASPFHDTSVLLEVDAVYARSSVLLGPLGCTMSDPEEPFAS